MSGRVGPDAFTETALRLLPVPPHGEWFWNDLEHRLDRPDHREVRADRTDPQPRPLRALPGGDDSLALVPPALRRPSNAVLVAVAAVAVGVVLWAGGSLVQDRTGDEGIAIVDAADGEPSAELDALVEQARPEVMTVSTLAARHEDASAEAAVDWIEAVEAGDAAAAWGVLGPASRAELGGRGGLAAELASLADGYQSWAGVVAEGLLVTPVPAREGGPFAVVTVVGDARAAALPVRLVGGVAVLEPFASAGALELVVPEPLDDDGERPAVNDGDELVIVVPAGANAPVLRLDDGVTLVCGEAEGTELKPMDDLPLQRCSYLPSAGLTAGAHTLTVAFRGADGASITADALRFDAA